MIVKEFWRLITCLVSLAGFIVVAASLLAGGECLLWAVGRGVLVFLALWVVLNLLGQFLGLAAGAETGGETQVETKHR